MNVEAIEVNPVTAIGKKKEPPPAVKQLMTDEERVKIQSLKELNYPFWRFIQIFFTSGARTTEMMQVRKEDVDLKNQMVAYQIKKGKARNVRRPFPETVLHLWKEVYDAAAPHQYLFSDRLCPGDHPVRADQVKRRWRLWAKEKLGIKADWYSLKHLYTDSLAAIYGTGLPAHLNKHDESMTVKHYAVGEKERKDELLKRADVKL